MMAGEFTLEMFISSQRMMKKMGSLGDIMKMMGLGGMLGISSEQQSEIADHGERMFKLYETAINSMTPEERKKPQIISMSRRKRISRGSGLKDNEIGQMLHEFEQMRQMFGQFSKMMPGMGGMSLPGMPKGMPGGMPGPGGAFPDLPQMPPGGLPRNPPPGFLSKRSGGSYYRKKGKRH